MTQTGLKSYFLKIPHRKRLDFYGMTLRLPYKAVKAEDGEQMVNVDVANAVIEFYINEDISELDQWDMLAAMRYAVTCGIAAQQELATVK